MYKVGLFLYIFFPTMSIIFETSRNFLVQCFGLTFLISFLVCVAYFYPLVLFLCYLFSKRIKPNHIFFRGQVALSSTLSVSLGLIGTFVGLAQMIAGIASGLNAEGSFSERMDMLLSSISKALDSMSLAFLTSIMGVTASVCILVACNYLDDFFKKLKKESQESGEEDDGQLGKKALFNVNDVVSSLKSIVNDSAKLVESKDQVLAELADILRPISDNNSLVQLKETFAELVTKIPELDENRSDFFSSIESKFDEVIKKVSSESKSTEEFIRTLNNFSKNSQKTTDKTLKSLQTIMNHVELMGNKNNDQVLSLMHDYSNKIEEQTLATINTMSLIGDNVEQIHKELSDSSQRNNLYIKQIAGDMHSLSKNPSDLETQYELAHTTILEESLSPDTKTQNNCALQPICELNADIVGFEVFLLRNNGVLSIDVQGKRDRDKTKESSMIKYKTSIDYIFRKINAWKHENKWKDEWMVLLKLTEQNFSHEMIDYIILNIEKISINISNISISIPEDILSSSLFKLDTLHQFKNIGGKLFVYDYGKGRCSVNKLLNIGLDGIQIYSGITQDIMKNNSTHSALLRSIVNIASHMNIPTIASGVQNQEHAERLEKLGVHFFQGSYFGLPANAKEIDTKFLS